MTDALDESRISAGDILRGTADLLRRGALRVAVAMTVLTVVGVALDSGMAGADNVAALNFLISIAMLVLQYGLTKAILRDLRGEIFMPSRFGAFFLLGLLTTLGVLAGLVLLIVPGIVLMVRWSIAVPILLGSDDGIFAALGHSWRETAPHFWPILLALLAIYAPIILLVFVFGGLELLFSTTLAGILLLNLALNGGLIAGWHAAVAICVALGETEGLTEVFE